MALNQVNEERKIAVSGLNIALKIWGDTNAKPVLCLHGKMDNAASFDLLAPLLPEQHLVAVDCPGTGFSSHYPDGILPHWKNDAFLLLKLIDSLQWTKFDIIAHSLGSFAAMVLALGRPHQVSKLIFLDILGPTVNFFENAECYLKNSIQTYLSHGTTQRALFPDLESAIQDRMMTGNISYQASEALVRRGVKKCGTGWRWTFDQRLRCVSSTVPYEDELTAMLSDIKVPAFLLRANHGVTYPPDVYRSRLASICTLTSHEVCGGHHVHMDDPAPVAHIVSKILSD